MESVLMANNDCVSNQIRQKKREAQTKIRNQYRPELKAR